MILFRKAPQDSLPAVNPVVNGFSTIYDCAEQSFMLRPELGLETFRYALVVDYNRRGPGRLT